MHGACKITSVKRMYY